MNTLNLVEIDEAYTLYRHRVQAMAYKILQDSEESSDVCQEVFKKLVPRYSTLTNEDDHLLKWLLVVARNTALKVKNKKKRHIYVEQLSSSGDIDKYMYEQCESGSHEIPASLEVVSPATKLVNDERKEENYAKLQEAIGTLPARLQEIVRLRYYEELSYAEIAEKLKLTQGNVGFLLNRAMTKIKKVFAWSNINREDI